jgi:hypothetical protein
MALKVTAWPNVEGFVLDERVTVVEGSFTTWLRLELVIVLKFESPMYTAVIVCVAMLRLLVENAAVFPVRAVVPRVLAPSMKVTLPVGVPVAGAMTFTVAVNVTF